MARYFLMPLAILKPHCLIKTGHLPPVGTYIAIMGAVAAAVTFRKGPPVKEKAAWIVLISLLMVVEIRNLYVAEQEQAQTVSSIKQV